MSQKVFMPTKEKANELFSKYYQVLFDVESDVSQESLISILAIRNACICVDEIILSLSKLDFDMIKSTNYWIDVKRELNSL